MQMPMPCNMLESEMIGAIKIKDGLFIGDELASTVSHICFPASICLAARVKEICSESHGFEFVLTWEGRWRR